MLVTSWFYNHTFTMKTINMNTAQIELLINQVSQYPLLYDSNNVEYADQHKRDQIWDQIGAEMNLSGDLCRAKWTILRSGYRKALRTRKAYARKKWRFEDNMSFLKECIQRRRKKLQECKPQNTRTQSSDSAMEEEDGLGVKMEPEEISFEECVLEDDKASSCDSLPTVADLARFVQGGGDGRASGGSGKDAVTQFFLSMAETVRGLPPLMQAEVKKEVFRCVNSAEIRYLQEK